MKKYLILLTPVLFFLAVPARGQTIVTSVGDGTPGYTGDGAWGNSCELNHPFGIAYVNWKGANIAVADRGNNVVRVMSTYKEVMFTIAGTGTASFSGDGGPASAAALNAPAGVAYDQYGNIYIGDAGNNRVRKIDQAGIITTFAGTGANGFGGDGGPATDAALSGPRGIAADSSGNIYIADPGNNRIRRVNKFGIISTFAGTNTEGYNGDGGPATAAQLNTPYGVATDIPGDVYIADVDNERIRKVNSSGTISTIAGNGIAGYGGDFGPATAAALNEPTGIAVGYEVIYIADAWNGRIRAIDKYGIITTIAGNGTLGYSGDGGPAYMAALNDPYGVAVVGGIYIADYSNNRIRYVAPTTGISQLAASPPEIIISPNPGAGEFTISQTDGVQEQTKIIISNVMGEKVRELAWNSGKTINVTVDVPDGIYFVNLVSAGRSLGSKLVVRH